MELRTKKMWAAAPLAAFVMSLAPGRALADELDPGELKTITEGAAVRAVELDELKTRLESRAVGDHRHGSGPVEGADGERRATGRDRHPTERVEPSRNRLDRGRDRDAGDRARSGGPP